jgi:hypothetical protein
MYTRHGTRARVITLAALAAFAGLTGLGGQSSVDVRRDGLTHFQRAFRKRVDRAGGWVGGSSPRSKNGGKRRKSAIRARRMNNSGNGNHWSRKHA